jgi:hypothetical protein
MSSPARALPWTLAALAIAAAFLTGCAAHQPTEEGGQAVGWAPSDGGPAADQAPAPTTEPAGVDNGGTSQNDGTEDEAPDPAGVSYPTTARAYAEATVAAWAGHDLDGLADLTTAQVHEQLLEVPGQPKTDWIHYLCDGAAGSSFCILRNGDGDQVKLKVTHQNLGGPHAVVEVTVGLTTYGSDADSYATAFAVAWASSNTARMRALARPDVVVAVNNNHQNRPQGNFIVDVALEHGGAGLVMAHVSVGSVEFRLDIGTTLLGKPKAIVGYVTE